jgi:SpoVK/Ycf46/Vps4 family AAA+-type ATPase
MARELGYDKRELEQFATTLKNESSGAGMLVLLSAPAGTGKTMAADLLASGLQQDLRRVDLNAVVSKYIGETEKNLDAVFADAERANAVLFLDEADALFGKRTEVNDAHDRYATVEVASLLQRIEAFSGVVVIAVNDPEAAKAIARRRRKGKSAIVR